MSKGRGTMEEIGDLLEGAVGDLGASYDVNTSNIELPTVYALQSIAGALLAIGQVMFLELQDNRKFPGRNK